MINFLLGLIFGGTRMLIAMCLAIAEGDDDDEE